MMSDFDVCLISGYGASANLEVEAQIAKMMYHLNTAPDAEEYNRRFNELNRPGLSADALVLTIMLDSKGKVGSGANAPAYSRLFSDIGQKISGIDSRYTFNSHRSTSMNLGNLQTLAINC